VYTQSLYTCPHKPHLREHTHTQQFKDFMS